MFFVNDDDPAENKAVCDLVNSGLDPGLLLKATFSFYVKQLEQFYLDKAISWKFALVYSMG